jgi:hypothetical protein
MLEPRLIFGQIIAYGIFAIVLGYFSNSPAYTYHDPEKALLMVSFSHASQTKEECRRFTQEELAELAPNMRRPMDCPRERVPVYLEITMDDEVVVSNSYSPTGLAKDGSTSIYESIPVKPGKHELVSRMRDSRRKEGFDYTSKITVDLEPRELFVIDFRKELGGFYYK